MSAEIPPGVSRFSRALAAAAGASAVVGTAVSLGIDLYVAQTEAGALPAGWTGSFPGLAMTVPGALLAWRIGFHPLARVLVIFGLLWVLGGVCSAYVNLAVVTDTVTELTQFAHLLFTRVGPVVIVSIPLALVMFPDGWPRERWSRLLSALSVASASVLPAVLLLMPGNVQAVLAADGVVPALAMREPPTLGLPLPLGVWATAMAIGTFGIPLGFAVACVVTVMRFRSGTAEVRAQVRWLTWSGLITLVAIAVWIFFPGLPQEPLMVLGMACLATSIMVAVSRYRLYDIDQLLSWTVLYAAVFIAVVLVDALLIFAVGSALPSGQAAAIATLVVLAVYLPLRDRLSRFAVRLVAGKRADPFTVMSTLVTRLDSSESPETELRMMADTIRSTFRLPYVHVQIRQPGGGVTASSSGVEPAHTERYPLVHQGEYIGRVCLGATNGPALSTRDRQLLETLIRQSAAALYASMAADELQRIREQLVSAREEERHRIHRDLHDGLGPTMAGIVLRLETARNLVLTDQRRALKALEAGVQEARGTVHEIRRLVHGLRPPSLDDVGLERALERQCALLSAGPDTKGTVISFAAERIGGLPSAVEVAAYRIVLEALNNVLRHADARSCDVRLRTLPEDDLLEITVVDDGVGIATDAVEGSGLRSQRDRAAELGGSTLISAAPSGGTLVRALLPLQRGGPRERHPDLTGLNMEETL